VIRATLAGIVLAAVLPGSSPAQTPPPRPPARFILEFGPQATLTIADSMRFGIVGGPRFAVRTFGGTRGSLSFGAGVLGDSATARIEGALEYQLVPRARGRPGFYFGGGLTGVVGAGRGGYLLLFVGLEQSPGHGSGWAIEAGLGGGLRIRGAWHFRRFPAAWRSR
jgi:hypothetical protein